MDTNKEKIIVLSFSNGVWKEKNGKKTETRYSAASSRRNFVSTGPANRIRIPDHDVPRSGSGAIFSRLI